MPSVLRSILAILAGFIAMVVVVMALTLISIRIFDLKSGHPTPGYLAINVAYSVAAAALGGCITAALAPSSPLKHGYILAGVMLVMGGLSYLQYRGTQPLWYQVLITIITPLAAIAGARLKAR